MKPVVVMIEPTWNDVFLRFSITLPTQPYVFVIMIRIAATKISAGVSVGIGEHIEGNDNVGDAQFEISDGRNVKEVFEAIESEGLQPVMSDYIYV